MSKEAHHKLDEADASEHELGYRKNGLEAPAAEPSRTTHRRRWVLMATVLVVLTLALGLGLGLGLHHSSSSSSSSSTSSSGSGGNATSTSSGTTAQNLSYIPRSTLWNTSQYTLAESGHVVSATPQVRVFNWTISEVMATPGGMTKPMIVVNNQSPGPTVHANLGDRLIFNVQNNMSNETTIHWHGQIQNGTNHYDGTYGITQCGIPPGGSMTYNWTAQTVGTYWWHAHRSEQYTDGLYGALITHSTTEAALNTVAYPAENEAVLLLSDMYNTPAMALQWRFTAIGTGIDGQPGDEPVPDGGMINGVSQAKCAFIPATDSTTPERRKRRRDLALRVSNAGAYYPQTNYCGTNTTDMYNVTLPAGTAYRLRLINAGTFLSTRFSVDGHNLTLVEVDGTSVEPITVNGVNLAVAQRCSVVVYLDKEPGAYWIRSELDMSQATYNPISMNATTLGVLRYDSVADSVLPVSAPAPTLPGNLSDLAADAALMPIEAKTAPLPTKSAEVVFNMQYTADQQHYMFMNTSSWTPSAPGQANLMQFQPSVPTSWSQGSQLSVVNEKVEVFDLVLNSQDDGTHPFHLHGHQFYVMSQGAAGFYGNTSALNVTNPMRRDTIVIPAYGHVVLRFVTDNPGVWAFHCHIGWHMSIGLLMTFVDLPSSFADLSIPQELRDMCTVDAKLGV